MVGRPEIFSELVEFGDENKANGMVGSLCLFRTVIDLKYLISTIPPEQWEAFEQGDYSNQTISLKVDIDSSEKILKYLQ